MKPKKHYRSNKFKAGLFLGIILFLVGILSQAQAQIENQASFGDFEFSGELVSSFKSDMQLSSDSSLTVQETIEYDFGANSRHGIFRNIPYKYTYGGANYNFRIRVFSVKDEAGRVVPFEVSTKGRDKEIKIGDPDRYVNGIKTYVIDYQVERAMNFGGGKDEFYWNATPLESEFPQFNTEINFRFPEGNNPREVEFYCYEGRGEQTKECGSVEKLQTGGVEGGYRIKKELLLPGQGVTVLLKLPKGVIQKPSFWTEVGYFLRDNSVFLMPVIVLIIMLNLWYFKGRDPEGRGTIITQFDPPEDLSPMQIGALYDERADQKDLSAEIINLAIKGHIRIKFIPGRGMFKKDDYLFEKIKDYDENNTIWEKLILPALMNKKVSQLKNNFYPIYESTKKEVFRSLMVRGYFNTSPSKIRGYYVAGAVLFLFLIFFVSEGNWTVLAAGGLSALIIGVIGYFMPRKTRKGVEAREQVLGLKRYLEVAEKDRIEFHNAPEKTPERFEKLLPYAMVLGVEQQWAQQFEGIYQQQPDWYASSMGGPLIATTLVRDLGGFQSVAASNLAVRPSSSAGGGSGFSGGGFAGGGGGGGSVGSW